MLPFILVHALATLGNMYVIHNHATKTERKKYFKKVINIIIPTGESQTTWLFTNMAEELNKELQLSAQSRT